jgi:hypothetical protein
VDFSHRRNDDDRQPRVGALHSVKQLEAVHAFHPHVANDGIDIHPLDDPEGRRGVGNKLAVVSLPPEEHSKRVAHLSVVVHDEDARMRLG